MNSPFDGLSYYTDLPDQMNLNGLPIANEDLAEEFVGMMEKKIADIVQSTAIDAEVYNGTRKITDNNKNFMSIENIRNAIQSLKLKNSEGYDRIPQRILIDGMTKLVEPFSILFNLIYSTNKIPEQWSMFI